MPDDLLMLAAGRAGGNVAPESLGSSHRRGYAIGLATVTQTKAIADAIIAEELRSVSQQKLADAPGDSPGTRQRPAIRRRRAGWCSNGFDIREFARGEVRSTANVIHYRHIACSVLCA
jgi:hypothetical protein